MLPVDLERIIHDFVDHSLDQKIQTVSQLSDQAKYCSYRYADLRIKTLVRHIQIIWSLDRIFEQLDRFSYKIHPQTVVGIQYLLNHL